VNFRNIIYDVWTSFRTLPLWVQLWMIFWLIPINAVSLVFVFEPMGLLVAFLANIAMLLNIPVMIYERRMSNTMALPHLPFWTPLVILIVAINPDFGTTYGKYLWVLCVTNFTSLIFDYLDAIRWLKGDRG